MYATPTMGIYSYLAYMRDLYVRARGAHASPLLLYRYTTTIPLYCCYMQVRGAGTVPLLLYHYYYTTTTTPLYCCYMQVRGADALRVRVVAADDDGRPALPPLHQPARRPPRRHPARRPRLDRYFARARSDGGRLVRHTELEPQTSRPQIGGLLPTRVSLAGRVPGRSPSYPHV